MCPVLLTQDYTFSQAEQLPSCIRRKKTLGVKMMVFWNIRVLASEYKPCLLGARICRQNHDKTQLKKSADISNLGYNEDHSIQWQANWFLQKKYRKKVLHRESMEERRTITGPFIQEAREDGQKWRQQLPPRNGFLKPHRQKNEAGETLNSRHHFIWDSSPLLIATGGSIPLLCLEGVT